MSAEPQWYELDVASSEELRQLLSERRNATERAVQAISSSSLDYINRFENYVSLNDPKYCQDLFRNRLPYIIRGQVGQGKVGTISLLSKGDENNLVVKSVKATPVRYLSLRIIDHPGESINPWNNYWNITDQNGKRKIITVGGDNFANQTSMHYILNLILGESPHYIHQYDAFYCESNGYNVIEYSNGGDLHNFLEHNVLTDDTLFNIIAHVLAPLSVLKNPEYNFNHSDLKAKNVFAHRTAAGTVFKIADYDKSSITWNGYRFYNWTFNLPGTASPITLVQDERYDTVVYVLSSRISLQLQTMHNPYSIPMSYDIYTFILSLFGSSNFWNLYINDRLPRFKGLMHQLFRGESYYIVMGKIAQNHKEMVSMSHINTILNGVYLQYDLSYVYEMVGLKAPQLVSAPIVSNRIVVSSDGHLCTSECRIDSSRNSFRNSCNTNTYSRTGLTLQSTSYNWDWC